MTKRKEFISVINTLKALSSTITDEQRIALLQQAVQQHGLSFEEANEILKESGFAVGEKIDYFATLGLSIEELQNQDESAIVALVEEAHKRSYSASLRAGGLPRPDGRTQEQWRNLLNQARDTLIEPQKRVEHITILNTEISQPVDPTHQEDLSISETEAISSSDQKSISVAIPEGMVHINEGDFQMEINVATENTKENSGQTVHVDAFCLDEYPVTNAQYKKFIDINPIWRKISKGQRRRLLRKRQVPTDLNLHCFDAYYLLNWHENNFPDGKDQHPVTHISWYAAMAYARWMGKRLPTEVEWEKAARGGLTAKKYPWGNELNSDMALIEKSAGETTSVGKYPANNYGLFDMVGNVWEWCLDEYDPDYLNSLHPQNPIAGVNSKEDLDQLFSNFWEVTTDRVLRGGILLTTTVPVQIAVRYSGKPMLTSFLTSSYGSSFVANIGFRCAWDTKLK